jgi:hypothetical protein
MDENFLGKPGFPGFSSDFLIFQSGCSPFKLKKNILFYFFGYFMCAVMS